jgi:hypothetical protein
MVNRISTLDRLGDVVQTGDLARVKDQLKFTRAEGVAIWGNAYTISTCGRSMDKVDYVIDHVVAAVRAKEESILWTGWLDAKPMDCALVFRWLTEIDGLGSFLAAQVVADLKNTEGHPLRVAPDWHSWAAHGPGSLRGLTRYWGHKVTPSGFSEALQTAHKQVMPYVASYVGDIHMQDMQNVMCEFDKYIRVHEGGHARNNYPPK